MRNKSIKLNKNLKVYRLSKSKNFVVFGSLVLIFLYSIYFLKVNNNLYLESSNILKAINDSFYSLNFVFLFSGKLFFFLLPFISITIFELLQSNGTLINKLNSTSVWKIKNSEKFPFTDLWYLCLEIIIGKFPLFLTLFTLGFYNFSDHISKTISTFYQTKIFSSLNNFNSIIIFLFLLAITDFMDYFTHRLSHSIPLGWDSHEAHHSSKEMTIINTKKRAPLGDFMLTPLHAPFTVFLGIFVNYYIQNGNSYYLICWLLFETLREINDYLSHSSMLIIYPKPISYFLMSPSLHWLHHSDNPEHFDSNFSTFTPIWDKIFGTYLSEKNIPNIKGFGVISSQYYQYHPLYCYTILPIQKLSKRIKYSFYRRSLSPLFFNK